MTIKRPFLVLQIAMAVSLSPSTMLSASADGPSAPSSASASDSANVATLSATYGSLQSIWDGCYKVKNECDELLNEGRNGPARKNWVDYYVSSTGQILDRLQSEYSKTVFPSDLNADVSSSWGKVGSALTEMQAAYKALQTDAAKVKSPNDGSFPAIFWGATGGIASGADKFDKALVETTDVLDKSRDNALLTMAQQATPATTQAGTTVAAGGDGAASVTLKGGARKIESGAGFKDVTAAARRARKSCFEFFGELERFNLLYANPPKGEPANMFYGGAFSKEEILSQYKYMPNLVFTSAPYVKLFSYRLPPRQAMLASYTADIGKVLNLMESELNDIHIPPGKEQAVAGPWEAAKQQFVDARQQYLDLYNLVTAASDQRLQQNIAEDQGKLGAPAMKIYDDMQRLMVAVNDVNAIIGK